MEVAGMALEKVRNRKTESESGNRNLEFPFSEFHLWAAEIGKWNMEIPIWEIQISISASRNRNSEMGKSGLRIRNSDLKSENEIWKSEFHF